MASTDRRRATPDPGLWLLRFLPAPVLRFFEGFWALPLLITLVGGAGFAALHLLGADRFERLDTLAGDLDIEGMRDALSAIAGGVLTVASLVFSLTFVALSITAQQLSPRMLDNVLAMRATQVLLGLTLSTFLFSAAALAIGTSNGVARLVASTPVALLLAFVTLVMVVVFSHAMTRVMRAEDMVSQLGTHYRDALARGLEVPVGCSAAEDAEGRLADLAETGTPVAAASTGYVGMVDYQAMLDWAGENDLLVALTVAENDFVLEGSEVARVAGMHDSEDDHARRLTTFLNLTDRRAAGLTATFEAAALSEAALKALSPGINDPATAVSCVNRLFHGFVALTKSDPAPIVLAGEDEVARVRRCVRGVADFIGSAVVPVVEAARQRAVLTHLSTLSQALRIMAQGPADLAALDRLDAEIDAALSQPE